MRIRLSFALSGLLALATVVPALAQDAADAEIRPREWLVIEPTDQTGRRPLRPDAVFRAHLLDPAAAPPVAGGKLTGERGEERAWQSVEIDDDDRVWLRDGKDWKWIAYAYATVEVPDDRVMLADLQSGATLFVNGEGFVGDVYGYGFGGVPVPLRKGTNHLFVRGVRGGFSLALEPVVERLHIATWDFTAADLGPEAADGFDASVLLLNATRLAVDDGVSTYMKGTGTRLRGDPFGDGPPRGRENSDPICPLGVAKLRLDVAATTEGGELGDVEILAMLARPNAMDHSAVATLRLQRRASGQARHVSFVSAIDGSVQQYAVLEPRGDTDRPMGLVLSVHGAGVNSRAQAGSYAPKPDFWIVAPTNRRPFGFDWQDWGRTDAYEVLADALDRSGVDRSRVYLTGHSMGGHGTWHLGANDPDGFAALAPSAGWISFDTYGRGRGRPAGRLRDLWHRADGTSRTLDLLDNLAQQPVFILHGLADDNVPPEQGETMERALLAAGAFPQAHYQKDAGHWWDLKENPGAECLDWPGFFEMFRAHRIAEHPGAVEFTSVAPVVDADHHWVHVHQPLEYGRKLNVRAAVDVDRETLEVHTSNVGAFRVDVPPWAEIDTYVVDGVSFEAALSPGGAWFVRDGAGWNLRRAGPGVDEKGPHRSGSFKRVFDNRFVLVHGTAGDERESAELLARARYDSEQWWYRGNGNAPVMSDATFLKDADTRFAGRNVILYGNADTNAAWDTVFRGDCPVRAERGAVHLGDTTFEGGDLAAVFLHPRRGDDRALAGAFADSGPAGSRLGYGLSVFTAGAGYPDYLVLGSDVLTAGDGGVRAAGWFDRRWHYDRGYLAPR